MFGQNDNTDNQDQVADANAAAPEPTTNPSLGTNAPSAPPTTFNPSEFASTPAAAPAPAPVVAPVSPAGDQDLIGIKQAALQHLTPLVDHLEQTPEEKFRTTMMMIQASDDQTLIKTAYEAAQAITDEKARAQALLDVVNEINYFTHTTNQTS